jgi:hypothetical protein
MKQTKLRIFSLAFLGLTILTLVFVACKKNKVILDDAEAPFTQTLTESEGEADIAFNDVYDNVMGYTGDGIGVGAGVGIFGSAYMDNSSFDPNTGRTDSLPACVTVTVSPLAPNAFPKTVTINFGTTGCPGPGGHIRRGIVRTVYTGRMEVPGSTATTTFDGHYIDSVKVEGTHIITNQSAGLLKKYNVRVIDGKLTKPSGRYIKRNKDRTITQTEGVLTIGLPLDDKFEITGTASGEHFNGTTTRTWSSTITDALVRRFTCPWFLTGKIAITRPTGQTAILNYAPINNGTCDNKASVTVGGNTVIITLP